MTLHFLHFYICCLSLVAAYFKFPTQSYFSPRLRRIRPTQSGVYACTARNEVGRAAARAEVYVQVPPMISRLPAASVVVEGGAEARLDCEAR